MSSSTFRGERTGGWTVDETVLEEGRKLDRELTAERRGPAPARDITKINCGGRCGQAEDTIFGECLGPCGPRGSKGVFPKHFDDHRRFRRHHNPWPVDLSRDGSVLRAKVGVSEITMQEISRA